MHRRGFLKSTGFAAAALSLSTSTWASHRGLRWQLLRAEGEAAGDALLPFSQCALPECSAEVVVIELGRFLPAEAGAVCERFELEAVYASQASEARFLASRHVADPVLPCASQPTRFVAERASLRRFSLEFQLAGRSCREECDLAGFKTSLLSPGTYLLVGPDRSGQATAIRGLRLGADPLGAPECAGERGFDCLAMRIGLPG